VAEIKIKNRNSREIINIKEDKLTLFLYNTILGRLLLKILILKFVSYLVGLFLSRKTSKIFINNYIKKNNIDMNEYPNVKYTSFNDFFTRKIKTNARKININKNILISPSDAKLSVYKINNDSKFLIKNSYYDLKELINDNKAKEYINGYICIFRLDVTDYHRYCYIDSGTKQKNNYIKGVFHTVRPISTSKYNIYKQNTRSWTVLKTDNFDDVIQVEVGAMMVGKIVNHHESYQFKKGEEKGYFKFGGSTICLLFKDNIVKIDNDIVYNSKNNIETIVKYGEKIGNKLIK